MYDTNHRYIQMALILKLSICHRENLPSLTYEELVMIFERLIWRKQKPSSLNNAVTEIFSITTDQMIGFLAKLTELQSYQQQIDDYKDVMFDHED